MLLSVAIPTYDDYERLRMTIHSLNLHHKNLGFEKLVFDNFGCQKSKSFCEKSGFKYVVDNKTKGTCYAKSRAVQEATGEFVLVIDSHVLIDCDGISKLMQLLSTLPANRHDIFHGPLVSDKGIIIATEMKMEWGNQSWGKWKNRIDKDNPLPEEPFEIWGHGCGLFCIRKSTWPGYHPRCAGFGGEEGVIHELYRARGGKAICLPYLRWTHTFNDAATMKHKITAEDKLRNHLLNFGSLPNRHQLWSDCLMNFAKVMPINSIKAICSECLPADLEIINSIEVKKQ